MTKLYIRGVTITPFDTRALAATANTFIPLATTAPPSGGGLTQIDDIEVELYNNVMFFIFKDLS